MQALRLEHAEKWKKTRHCRRQGKGLFSPLVDVLDHCRSAAKAVIISPKKQGDNVANLICLSGSAQKKPGGSEGAAKCDYSARFRTQIQASSGFFSWQLIRNFVLMQALRHNELSPGELFRLLRKRAINLGGNRSAKIYGTLNCRSGKRLLSGNRVFFKSEADAIENGYRPCGHCMREAYKKWKLRQQ